MFLTTPLFPSTLTSNTSNTSRQKERNLVALVIHTFVVIRSLKRHNCLWVLVSTLVSTYASVPINSRKKTLTSSCIRKKCAQLTSALTDQIQYMKYLGVFYDNLESHSIAFKKITSNMIW